MPTAANIGNLDQHLVYADDNTYNLNGNNGDAIDVGHHAGLSLPNGTISLTFSLDKLYGTMALISKDLEGNGAGQFTVWVKDGQLIMNMEDGTGYEWLKVPMLILDDGQDYALSVSFGDDGLMVWLDGKLVAAEPEFKQGIDANDASLVIGGTRAWRDADEDAHSEMDGTIGNVMIFDTQLSTDDVVKVTGAVDPMLGHLAAHHAQMADLAPAFTQLHGASDTFLEILGDYGVSHHGHMMHEVAMKTANYRDNGMKGTGIADGMDGGAGDDVMRGRGGDDVMQGGYGNDKLLGGAGNDVLDGGHGEDTLRGGEGDDLLIARADAREPDVYPDADRDEGDPYNELTNGKLYPDQPIHADDVLEGGKGADIFYFQTLINAKDYIIEKHTRDDGTINWHGVAGENDNIHDHWVDALGHDVVLDFNRAEGDRIVVEGHTTEILNISYGDANGDGVMDHSIIALYSDQGSGGGAHNDDRLGTITVYGDLITEADIEQDAGPAYGIVTTIDDLDEAVTPTYDSTDTGPITPPAELPDLSGLGLPDGLTPVMALTGTHSFTPDDRAPLIVAHSDTLNLASGTIAMSFTANALGMTQALLTKDASGYGPGGHLSVYVQEDGDLVVRLQDETRSHYLEVDAGVMAGKRYDLAVGFGADGLQMYLNGALVAYDTELAFGLDTNTEALIIGAAGWNNTPGQVNNVHSHFNGTIEDVMVFDSQVDANAIFGDAPRDDFAYFTGKAQNATFAESGDGDLVVTANGTDTTITVDQEFLEFADMTFRTTDVEFGTIGNDTLNGEDTADVLNGKKGDDTLRGYGNDDLIFGGQGDDYAWGGDGKDAILGEAGNDSLDGGDGCDMIWGGIGNDQIKGGAGSDKLFGGLGDDTIYGHTWGDEGTAGGDKAYFDGDFADFTFESTTWWNSSRGERIDVLIVTDAASGGADGYYEGRDHLIDIDKLVFGDMTMSFDDLI
ncbi:MAG: LamG-like jellyroll fold domain-containing protein [Pseudomonadota bacterium]